MGYCFQITVLWGNRCSGMSFELRKLEDVCDILDHIRIPITSRDRKEGPYPYYGANGIQDYIDDYIFDDDLVLLAEDGGNFGSKEKPIAYRISGKTWVNNHAHVLKPKNIIDVDYLCYSLMYYDVSGLVNGATRQKLTQSEMRKINIRYRSLEKQRQIVFKIKLISNIISSRKHQLCNLDLLVKSRFIEMFGDPVTNEKGWVKVRLADKCCIITGNTPPRANEKYYGSYIEWIKSDNITSSMYLTKAAEYLSEEGLAVGKKVESGSVLMTCIAGSLKSIGNVAIADRPVTFNQQINAVVTNEQNTLFMYEQFKLTKEYITCDVNMALKGILSKGQLSEKQFIFPPIELQNQFADFVAQVDKSKFVVTAKFQ